VVICLGRGADLHMAQLMPLPLTVSCVSKIQIGFVILVPAHPGNPRESPEGRKTDVYVLLFVIFDLELALCLAVFEHLHVRIPS